jgi:hypothetical protein
MSETLLELLWSKTTYHTYQHFPIKFKGYTVAHYVSMSIYELNFIYQAQFSTGIIMSIVQI